MTTIYGEGFVADTIKRAPQDDKGRFIPVKCELCGGGTLRYQGSGFWSCDGLLDPEDPNKELEACPAFHYDGEPRINLDAYRPRARGVRENGNG